MADPHNINRYGEVCAAKKMIEKGIDIIHKEELMTPHS
jgi:hypothetical protein